MQGITLDGVFISKADLYPQAGQELSVVQERYRQAYGEGSIHCALADFLREWFDSSPLITVKTSGSTGTPKILQVEKQRMVNSAKLTVAFLGLKAGDSAQLCMPLQYIAGKMVVVRSLVAGLNLLPCEPSSHPLQKMEHAPVFSAMIPLQVSTSLFGEQENAQGEKVEGERAAREGLEAQRLREIEHLIIGGGSVDAKLGAALADFPHQVWSTYGMTETLSHIALRRLNGPQASEWYTPFATVEIEKSAEDTLVIYAPQVNSEHLVTNDRVEFNEQGQFRILGRKDNVINSGGVKLQIEEIEHSLLDKLPCPATISSQRDERFGERVVLLLARHDAAYGTQGAGNQESQDQSCTGLAHLRDLSVFFCLHQGQSLNAEQQQTLDRYTQEEGIDFAALQSTLASLPKYWRPKRVYLCDSLPQTATGKPQRARTKKLLAQIEE